MRLKGYGVLAVLVRNRILILAILVINKVWYLHANLELSMFLKEATFSSLSIRPSLLDRAGKEE